METKKWFERKFDFNRDAGQYSAIYRQLHDIEVRNPQLTAADLTNRATMEAGFNQFALEVLLDRFLAERRTTIALLDTLNMGDESRTSLHPRLQQPMRMIDHAYFVAEHDDHHIERIHEIALL